MRTAYQCRPDGVYTGETPVQEDFFEKGTFLLPPNCTLQPPPEFDPSREQAVFSSNAWTVQAISRAPLAEPVASQTVATAENKPKADANQIAVIVDGQWRLVGDNRGLTYWLADGTKCQIHAIGEEMPHGSLLSPPDLPESSVPT